MSQPYRENDPEQQEQPPADGTPRRERVDAWALDRFFIRVLQFTGRVGGKMLDSISDALPETVSLPDPGDDLARTVSRLRSKLNVSQGQSMASGLLGLVFGVPLLLPALLAGTLASVAPATVGMFSAQAIQMLGFLAALLCPLSVASCLVGWVGVRYANLYGHLRRYLKALHGWTGTLDQIAGDAVIRPRTVRTDLQTAVSAGYLGDAYYDAGTDTLYLDKSLYRPPAPPPAADLAAAAPAPQPAADTAPAVPAAEPSEVERFAQQGMEFLACLRACRDRLPADAGAELDAMQRTCGALIGFVQDHPGQLPRVRRFVEYYLPTTRRLLDTALGLGEADTADAQTVRRDITAILHTLNTAFAGLYDTLFQDVSLDVSAEIDTLETMLSQDGLSGSIAGDLKPNGK